MSLISNKRSVMTLFTNKMCSYCHQVRIVLAEKGIVVEFVEVDLDNKPEELWELNPYGTVPTLVDRDMVLYEAGIIQEYLEERFPHPPLMPIYPVARARNRLMRWRVEQDWYTHMNRYYRSNSKKEQESARQELLGSLLSVAAVFTDQPYFLSEEFTLIDCSLAPLLWRLPHMGIKLPEVEGKSIIKYMKRIFERESIHASLTDAEREIRESEMVGR